MEAEDVAPDSMGVFVGATYAEQQGGWNEMPAEILLFLDNIRAEAQSDPEEFRNQVRITYLHELGHYLGLDEGALFTRDLE
jgi:predicted Zn-dependent protease with MMP-like domain